MSRLFYHVMQDNAGNLLFDVTGTMRLAGSGTLATIYGDEALTVILPNPLTNHPSFGSFKCFLGAGDYDFYMAKGGYTFETLTGVQGHGTLAQQDASAVAITGGTVTGLAALRMGGNSTWPLDIGVSARFTGEVGIGGAPVAGTGLYVTGNGVFQTGLGVGTPVLYGLDIALQTRITGETGLGTPPIVGRVLTCGGAAYKPGGGSWSDSSDASLKTNIAPIPDALGTLLRLAGHVYEWTEDLHKQALPGPQYGLIAQEVEPVVPQWVGTEADGLKTLNITGFESLVVEALKQIVQRLEAVEAR